MDAFLGIDLGTSYFKLGLFDRPGNLLGLERIAAPVRAEGVRREIPVEDFWAVLREGLADVLQQAKCSASDVRGVSYASQANTFLLLDENDQPVTPLVLWTDRRADEPDPAVAEFRARPDFLPTTGLGFPAGKTMAVTKLRWFQTHQPDLWRRTGRVMSISDYLTFCLTGRYVGDAGTAALLGLLDLPELDWWDAALQAAGVTREQFSTPHRPGTNVGKIMDQGSKLLGVPAGATFTVGSLDHHIAALGAGIGHVADISVSLGTVLACLSRFDNYVPKSGCIMGPAVEEGSYYQIAFDDGGASVLEWYRNTFAAGMSFAELSAAAKTVSPGCDGLVYANKQFFNGCRGSRSPEGTKQPRLPNDVVAPSFIKDSANHGTQPPYTHGHHVRAIMESVAGTASRLIESLCEATKPPEKAVATGGGAQSDVWLEILTRTTGVKFIPAPCCEAAARGAAMLAARM